MPSENSTTAWTPPDIRVAYKTGRVSFLTALVWLVLLLPWTAREVWQETKGGFRR